MIEYTYETFTNLISELKNLNYEFVFFDSERNKSVILRHDIDWSPDRALKMAEIEAEMGIQATYFFMVTSPMYNLFAERTRSIVGEIEALGHEVSLHFSTHQYFKSRPLDENLIKMINREIELLMRVTSTRPNAISFHMPPDYVLGKKFDNFTNTYAPRFLDSAYRADSSMRWRAEDPLAKPLPDVIQYLIHPGLWGQSDNAFSERLYEVKRENFDNISEFVESQYLYNDARGGYLYLENRDIKDHRSYIDDV